MDSVSAQFYFVVVFCIFLSFASYQAKSKFKPSYVTSPSNSQATQRPQQLLQPDVQQQRTALPYQQQQAFQQQQQYWQYFYGQAQVLNFGLLFLCFAFVIISFLFGQAEIWL